MDAARRTLLTALPATALAGSIMCTHAQAQVGPEDARSLTFTPAAALSAAARQRHEAHMKRALSMIDLEGPPYASVIVDRTSGEVVCEGRVRGRESPIQHGEIVAINACATLERHRNWDELTLYTTGEPCPMCQSAIVWSGIGETVYGTSVATLAGFGLNQFRLDSPTVAAAAPFYSGAIIGGVLQDETDAFYTAWAEQRRQQQKN